jgi:hypothetical protein
MKPEDFLKQHGIAIENDVITISKEQLVYLMYLYSALK